MYTLKLIFRPGADNIGLEIMLEFKTEHAMHQVGAAFFLNPPEGFEKAEFIRPLETAPLSVLLDNEEPEYADGLPAVRCRCGWSAMGSQEHRERFGLRWHAETHRCPQAKHMIAEAVRNADA